MRTRPLIPPARASGYPRDHGVAGRSAELARVLEPSRGTRLFALALLANAFDLGLSWIAVLRFGLAAEANPLPIMAWGWAHGLIGAMAVKAALLAIVVATAAIKPRHAQALLVLVGFAGVVGAVSALIVL